MLWIWCNATDNIETNTTISNNTYDQTYQWIIRERRLCRQVENSHHQATTKKVGLELICKNYRPVSSLSFLSKILEKCVLLQLNTNCMENRLLPGYQSAYREHFWFETTLVKLIDDILWNMEGQELTALVAIDLSATFYTGDHNVLLDLLNNRFGLKTPWAGSTATWDQENLNKHQWKLLIRNWCQVFSSPR